MINNIVSASVMTIISRKCHFFLHCYLDFFSLDETPTPALIFLILFLCLATKYSTTDNTVDSTMQYNAMQCNEMQSIQYSTYSAVQYNECSTDTNTNTTNIINILPLFSFHSLALDYFFSPLSRPPSFFFFFLSQFFSIFVPSGCLAIWLIWL